MATDPNAVLDQIDRALTDACRHADEAICGEPRRFRTEYARLSDQSKCAIVFIKQWIIVEKLPVDVDDVDTVLTLNFSRSAPAGEHVHERILQGMNYVGAAPYDGQNRNIAERESLARMYDGLTAEHRDRVYAAFETLTKVMILLSHTPDEGKSKAALFYLAKLLDPDLGESPASERDRLNPSTASSGTRGL